MTDECSWGLLERRCARAARRLTASGWRVWHLAAALLWLKGQTREYICCILAGVVMRSLAGSVGVNGAALTVRLREARTAALHLGG